MTKVPDVVVWPTSELRGRVINGRDGERAIFEEVEVSFRLKMLRASKSKRNSSSPYAASNPAASRLGRGSGTQPQPQPALSTPEAPVQPVEMPVPDVTISTPANKQIPVPATSGVHGQTQWSSWTPCDKECYTGTKSRARECPEGDSSCSAIETRKCNVFSCNKTTMLTSTSSKTAPPPTLPLMTLPVSSLAGLTTESAKYHLSNLRDGNNRNVNRGIVQRLLKNHKDKRRRARQQVRDNKKEKHK
uniref:Uncharacterized protein n=1 Tax=Magallana gigas TaxID=29159 RepID=K1PGC5_MAGGI